jgi:hypothetical protein
MFVVSVFVLMGNGVHCEHEKYRTTTPPTTTTACPRPVIEDGMPDAPGEIIARSHRFGGILKPRHNIIGSD